MRWVVIALAASLVCSGGRAWADDAAVAREHAQKATTFYNLAKYDDAIREFEAAYEAKADPAWLYNIAQCHRLAGHDNEALRLYRNYLRDAPRGPLRTQAEQWIATLEKAAAEHPAPPPVAAELPAPPALPAPPESSPAPPAAPASGPAVANPGPLLPQQMAPPEPGRYPQAQGAPADSPPTAPDAMPPPQPSTGHRTAGVVVASIGGAFVIGGVVCGLIARAEAKKVEEAAARGDAFDPSVEKAGRNAETAQWIGYGLGAVGLAVGVILFAKSPASSETGPVNRVAVAPLVAPGLGGALMRVAF